MNRESNRVLVLEVIFHPATAFSRIKETRDRLQYKAILVFLALISAVRLLSVYGTHFPLSSIDPRSSNLLMELGILLLPILTWIVSAYAMTSILDGEVKFKELFMATVLSMVPYILFQLPLTAVSYLFDLSGKGTYTFLNALITVWVLLLFFTNLKMLNGYTVGKTIKVALLSLATIVFIWFLIFIFYSLTLQVLDFIRMILLEIRLKIR